MPTIDLTKSVSSEIVVNGVDGTLTYAYNGLQNVTNISVALDEVTQFDLTYGGETKSIIAKAYSFNVAGEVATGATVVGAAVDASTLTKVTVTEIKEFGALTKQKGDINNLIDGFYAQSTDMDDCRYQTKHDKETRLSAAFELVPAGSADYNDHAHVGAFVMKLENATDLAAFRFVAPDNGSDFLCRNFSVMTKTADGEWKTAVATVGQIIPGSTVDATDTAGWVKVAASTDSEAEDGLSAYWVYDVALTTNNEDVVEVAVMINVEDAAGAVVTPQASSWNWWSFNEFAFFAAPELS
jgi:hypothetical protein